MLTVPDMKETKLHKLPSLCCFTCSDSAFMVQEISYMHIDCYNDSLIKHFLTEKKAVTMFFTLLFL